MLPHDSHNNGLINKDGLNYCSSPDSGSYPEAVVEPGISIGPMRPSPAALAEADQMSIPEPKAIVTYIILILYQSTVYMCKYGPCYLMCACLIHVQ